MGLFIDFGRGHACASANENNNATRVKRAHQSKDERRHVIGLKAACHFLQITAPIITAVSSSQEELWNGSITG